MTASPAAQARIPLRFSTIRTSFRRLAWCNACTTLNTTERLRTASEISRSRSAMARSASSRVVISPVDVEMADADVGDLTHFEEAMAVHVTRPLPLWSSDPGPAPLRTGSRQITANSLQLVTISRIR